MEPKLLFMGFTGPNIEQTDAVFAIADGYECWDLTKFTLDSFIGAIQAHIPPVNTNVLRLYKSEPGQSEDGVAITDREFRTCSWGLLLPDCVPDAIVDSYPEILFLLNLYSPVFLYPVFYVTSMGVRRPDHKKVQMTYFHTQGQAERFKRQEFIKYYEMLITESHYGSWNAIRMATWKKEEWRLFVACLLYSELKAYENSKYVFIWQRESADMATLLEALFTAGADSTEVGYKLRKRAAALIGFYLPTIEKDIKKLYEQRSSFVHGSFFQNIAKDVKVIEGIAQLPSPPFDVLYQQKECVRHALIAYLYLSKVHRDTSEFKGHGTVMDILEEAIINLELRTRVRTHAEFILSLCAAD
jgi:hypothetical protein